MLVSMGGMEMCSSACIFPHFSDWIIDCWGGYKPEDLCILSYASKPLWTTEVHDLSVIMTWVAPNILALY